MSILSHTWTDSKGYTFWLTFKSENSNDKAWLNAIHHNDIASQEEINIPSNVTITVEGNFFHKKIAIIGKDAFFGYTSLKKITIPETVVYIEREAFTNCSEDFTIYCKKGSYAESWAKANGYTTSYAFSEMESFLKNNECTSDSEVKLTLKIMESFIENITPSAIYESDER